jgi:hypothetical protein
MLPTENNYQQFFHCCYGWLPSDSPDIVDVVTGRYQAMHVLSLDRCIAMAMHTILIITASLGAQSSLNSGCN